MDQACPANPQPVSWVHGLRRWTFAGVGLLSVGVGWVGVFVPGLPTTIFLLIASYCFARSCPWLERRLLRVPVFARYMKVLDEGQGMTRRSMVTAMVTMWACVAVSLVLLSLSGHLTLWLAVLIVAAAVVGTLTIALYARQPVPR